MTPDFYQSYLEHSTPNQGNKRYKAQQLAICNPNKFMACEYLINYHKRRGDKIIVFSDDLFSLKELATKLMCPYIKGVVTQQERLNIFEYFQKTNDVDCIFLSSVGDTSIDLPVANVII